MSTRRIYSNRNRRIKESEIAFGYQEYLKTDLWASIRSRVLQRDNGACRICGNPARQVHHTNYTNATLSGRSLCALFAICASCHKFIEFNQDGTKAHLFREVRKRIRLLAHLKGRKFVWPKDDFRKCAGCSRKVRMIALDDSGRCRKCLRLADTRSKSGALLPNETLQGLIESARS